MYTVPPEVQQIHRRVEAARNRQWLNHPTNAPRVANYMEAALAGEWAFGVWSGLAPDYSDKAGGDGGVDFRLPSNATVDVKTVNKGGQNLLHKCDHPCATILVMAEYFSELKAVDLLGWTWAFNLRASEPRFFGQGYKNWHMERDDLYRMDDLKQHLLAESAAVKELIK